MLGPGLTVVCQHVTGGYVSKVRIYIYIYTYMSKQKRKEKNEMTYIDRR